MFWALKTAKRGSQGARRGGGPRVSGAAREQCQGLLELLVAPVQLLHLRLVLRPHLVQLLQQALVGADQGAGGGDSAQPGAARPPRGPASPAAAQCPPGGSPWPGAGGCPTGL